MSLIHLPVTLLPCRNSGRGGKGAHSILPPTVLSVSIFFYSKPTFPELAARLISWRAWIIIPLPCSKIFNISPLPIEWCPYILVILVCCTLNPKTHLNGFLIICTYTAQTLVLLNYKLFRIESKISLSVCFYSCCSFCLGYLFFFCLNCNANSSFSLAQMSYLTWTLIYISKLKRQSPPLHSPVPQSWLSLVHRSSIISSLYSCIHYSEVYCNFLCSYIITWELEENAIYISALFLRIPSNKFIVHVISQCLVRNWINQAGEYTSL